MSEERTESNALLATTETNVNNPSKSTFTGPVEPSLGARGFSPGGIPVGNLRSCSLILPASVSRIFFRCLIFNCYNISICKKEKIKDETTKKIRETNGGQIKDQD